MRLTPRSIFISLCILLVTFVGLSYVIRLISGAGETSDDRIFSSRHLRVSIDRSPEGMIESDSSYIGQNYHKVQLLAKRLGFTVDYIIENNLGKQIEMLNGGECDLIARNIPVTTTMRDTIAFTESLSTDKQVLVQRKKGDTKAAFAFNQLDLRRKTITLPKESPSQTRIENLMNEIGDTIFMDFIDRYDKESIAVMVALGEFDYTICDLRTARRLAREYKNLDIHLAVGFSQLQSWAVRKENVRLLDSLNTFIREELNDQN